MTTTTKTADAEVLDAAAEVVDTTLIRPSDVKGSEAHRANELDREIRDGFAVVLASEEKLRALVAEAKASQIHRLLTDPQTSKPYKSWTAYVADVVSSQGVTYKGVPKGTRHIIVGLMLNAGMTQSAIHKATGLALGTINADRKALITAGEVDPDVETEATDGSKGKGGKAAAIVAPKVEKTNTDKATAHVEALTRIVDQMDDAELAEVKAALGPLTRHIAARLRSVKAAA